jgi:hypothetical protein
MANLIIQGLSQLKLADWKAVVTVQERNPKM